VGELIAAGEAELKTGPFGTQLKASEYTEEGTTVINVRNIGMGSIKADKLEFISDATRDRLSSHLLRSGDIVFGRKGAVERHVFIRKEQDGWFQGSDCLRLRFNSPRVVPLFASYFFITEEHQRWMMNQCSHGATMSSLNQDILGRIDLPLPPLPVQRRIAGILAAYDELIENSQRRIRILEAMARALYREWFIHFRYPGSGRETGSEPSPAASRHPLPTGEGRSKLVTSPLGDIPQGWEVKRVPECVDISPRVAVPRDGEKPFVPMGCLSNDSMLITDIESRAGNSGAKFQNGDTLFARITPCLENGKTGFVQFLPDARAVGFGSTEFIVLRSRTLTPEFVYLLARSDEFRGVAIKSMSGATGRQRVREQCFDDFQIVQPPRALLDRFSAIVAPSFRLIYKLHGQVQNLRWTRDLLLPRLLSGQVNLKEN
jgi:type I restriction enzyme S subunit